MAAALFALGAAAGCGSAPRAAAEAFFAAAGSDGDALLRRLSAERAAAVTAAGGEERESFFRGARAVFGGAGCAVLAEDETSAADSHTRVLVATSAPGWTQPVVLYMTREGSPPDWRVDAWAAFEPREDTGAAIFDELLAVVARDPPPRERFYGILSARMLHSLGERLPPGAGLSGTIEALRALFAAYDARTTRFHDGALTIVLEPNPGAAPAGATPFTRTMRLRQESDPLARGSPAEGLLAWRLDDPEWLAGRPSPAPR
ncbi:MAG: hypothetical protein HY719_13510 [Planctomycetes bacterium]|nr:hypothetical protein [Planctomycetota bacterium]